MSTAHNGNDYERLKDELRRLKRRSAPWYFESALHQRLHGKRRKGRLRPITTGPVLVVAILTLIILAIAVYAVLVRSTLVVPAVEGEKVSSPDTLRGVLHADSLRVRLEKHTPRAVPRAVPERRSSAPANVGTRADTMPPAVTPDTPAVRADSTKVLRDTPN